MRYTRQEREDLARRKEQWILRAERGEDLERVSRDLPLNLKADTLRRLKHRYQVGGRKWTALLERRHGIATKGTAEVKAFLKKAQDQHPQATGADLRIQVWERFELDLSLSRLNELLHAEGLSNAPGRPRKAPIPETPSASERDLDNAGAFFPLGALTELGVPDAVQNVVEAAQVQAAPPGRVLQAAWALTWAKLLHLIFLPVLDATRPWQLRYALGDGLLGVCRIAYRFDTIDRCLGELTRLHVGDALRQALCRTWVQTLTEPAEPLHLYVDAHLKPHWTHLFMPCGKVTMLNRVLPCTRQVVVTNAQGYIWEILDQVGDAHLTHTLPGLEQELERVTDHRVTLTVVDREANGLALAQTYAQTDHLALLTLLDSTASDGLLVGTPAFQKVFRLTGRWQPLTTQPGEWLAPAVWAPEQEASDDPRVFWLVQQENSRKLLAVYSLSQPVTDCAPDVRALLRGSGARTAYRTRWPAMENVIREMVNGDNLNENYGYEYRPVPNRLRQRQQADAQAQVNTTQTQLAHTQGQLEAARVQLAQLEQAGATKQVDLAIARAERQAELHARQQADQPTRRVEQQLAQLARQAETLTLRLAQRTDKLQTNTVARLEARRAELDVMLAERQTRLDPDRHHATDV